MAASFSLATAMERLANILQILVFPVNLATFLCCHYSQTRYTPAAHKLLLVGLLIVFENDRFVFCRFFLQNDR